MRDYLLPMDEYEIRILARVLELAADEFGNHSCNDFDLVKDGQLSPDESLRLRKEITRAGDYPDDKVPHHNHNVPDWLVMLYFAKRFRNRIEE